MARQLWLADVLRAAGLAVVEVDGWRDRGSANYSPQGVIIHETQGSATSSDASEIKVMINGREDLAGPIAQLYLSRTGTWHVVTAGRSNHVKTGWGGAFAGFGNKRLLGIESQHAEDERWTPQQYDSYVRGVAAILEHTRWPPPVGHKEHQPGDKTDPMFDMDRFRLDVAAAMRGDDEMSVLVRLKGEAAVWIADGVHRRRIDGFDEFKAIKAAAKAGHLNLALAGAVLDVASLAPYGADIAVAISDAQIDALAEKVAARLGGA